MHEYLPLCPLTAADVTFAAFTMDALQEGDEVYVPTRWLQVIRDDGSLRGGTIGKARISP